MKALIYDFGGPVLKTPFELIDNATDRLNVPRGSFPWTGPFDPSRDELWRSFQAGEIREVQYWAARAEEFSALTGLPAEMPIMMGYFYDAPESDLIRPLAVELTRDAHAAGLKVGVLTNDLHSFHDQAWIDHITILNEFDELVDGRRDGFMKPDPRAYQLILDRLGIEAHEAVFLDDQPINLAGARDVGLIAVHLDPTNPGEGYAKVREHLFD